MLVYLKFDSEQQFIDTMIESGWAQDVQYWVDDDGNETDVMLNPLILNTETDDYLVHILGDLYLETDELEDIEVEGHTYQRPVGEHVDGYHVNIILINTDLPEQFNQFKVTPSGNNSYRRIA